MYVVQGAKFTATLVDPGGITTGLGARVEVPITRAIVSAWAPATLVPADLVNNVVAYWTVTLDAPLLPGEYELVWMDGFSPPIHEYFDTLVCVSNLSTASGNFPAIDVTSAGVRPSTDEIARLARTRTRNADTGVDEGTFTATTFPTADAVDGTIDDAMDAVMSWLPDEIDPLDYPKVKQAIKYQTAILVETSFFRVEAGTNGQSITQLNNMLTATLAQVAPAERSRYVGLF